MLKQSVFMITSVFVRLFANVVSLLMLARIWGPDQFGVFTYPLTIAGLVTVLIDLGFNLQVVRDVSRSPINVQTVVSQALVLKLVSTFLVFAVLVTLDSSTSLFAGFQMIFWPLLIAYTFTSFGLLFNLPFRSLRSFGEETKIALWANLVHLAIVISLGSCGFGPEFVAFGFMLSKGFFLIESFVAYRRVTGAAKIVIPCAKELFKAFQNGLPYAIHSIFGTLYFQIDTIIVGHYLGAREVGIYQAGCRVLFGGLILSDVLTNTYLPYMAKELESIKKMGELTVSLLRYCLTVGVVGFVLMSCVPETIVRLLYGKAGYEQLGDLLPSLGIVMFLRYLAAPYGLLLTVADSQGIRMIAVCTAFILSVVLNLLLIPKLELNGAILASIITHVILVGIYIAFAWKQLRSLALDRRSWLLMGIGLLGGGASVSIPPNYQFVKVNVAIICGFSAVCASLTKKQWTNALNRLSVSLAGYMSSKD